MVWIIAGGMLLLLSAVLFLRSRYEQNHVAIHCYEAASPKIGKTFDGYRIAVMADLHDMGAGKRNNRMMAELCRIHPDAVMIAGDMVLAKRGRAAFQETEYLLSRLAFRFPVYYAMGNHEKRLFAEREKYPHAGEAWYRAMQKAGVTILDNVSLTLQSGEDKLTISGLSLEMEEYRNRKELKETVLEELLGPAGSGEYHILLAHSPAHFHAYADWGADLVFSGHYHGGTIRLPLVGGMISPGFRLFPKWSKGLYRCGSSTMIVSGGLGNHSVNIRLGNMPELLIVTLRHTEEKIKDEN